MESSSILKYNIEQEFIINFGAADVLLFAPGRANIIGEHTDYNEGFVLPFAIGQGIYFYASKAQNSTVKIIAADIQETSTFDLKEDHLPKYGWEKFVFQVIEALGKEKISGFNLVFGGDLPIGGGISSSSALTCGLVSLMNDLYDLGLTKDDIVRKSIEAERGYGVRGGIMDQFTIVNAIKDYAILLDCRDNSYLQIPLHLSNHSFYLFNTNVKHNLLHTDYNNRRAECEKAVEKIAKSYRPISSLRDLDISDIAQIKNVLDEKLFRRASFVIKENQRVMDAKQALLDDDLITLGKLLSASHEGLSQDYEVSCHELDWLVTMASENENILGARMMGGGFGGCTINLVKGPLDQNWIDEISQMYTLNFGMDMFLLPIISSDGIRQYQS